MYGRASDTRVKFSVIKNAQKSAPRESTGPRITTLATGQPGLKCLKVEEIKER